MATTRLMPLHTGKGRSVSEALGRTVDYVKDPDKTDGGHLISAFQCNPAIVDQEFLFSKRQYAELTGREPGKNDVIAYHLRQSFKPGEIDAETANKIGYELAKSLTKGKHAFIVCTHVDKKHIHNHIIFNSTSIDCTRKFRNFWNSAFAIRRISDILCAERGLSIIENPKPSRGDYGSWLDDKKPPTIRAQLEQMIDAALAEKPKTFDAFLDNMKAAGVEVKQGKHLAFRIPNGKRFIRCDSLGADYSETAIRERISGKRIVEKKEKPTPKPLPEAPQLLIDLQSKMRLANTPGYERWARSFNLKEMAKTMSFLKETGLMKYDDLARATNEASDKYDDLRKRLTDIESRLGEIAEMQKWIGTYGKTRDIYMEYKKLPPRKQRKFYNEHVSQITACEGAKEYFNSLGLKKLPSMKSLKQEYAEFTAEKRKLHPQMREARDERWKLMIAKSNVDYILSKDPTPPKKQRNRSMER